LHQKLVLRLAIQLDLKFPYLTRCCQTHRQSPLLPFFTSTPEVRALSSAGITRPHRSYGPLRLSDWPPPFLTTFGVATPNQSRASLTDPDRLLCMPCSIPRWTGSGARWLASCAFPRGFLPCPCSLPRFRGGSASTSLLRGLLKLHSRYGLQSCSPTIRGLYREAPPWPVTRLGRSQATKFNQQPPWVGPSPTGDLRR